MKNDALHFWEAERARIAAGIRSDRIDAREGSDLLTVCDERIREHRDGIVPQIEANELPAELAPAAVAMSNVTPLRPREVGYTATLLRQRQIRDQALRKYRADMKRRTGRDPVDVSARAALMAARSGLPVLRPSIWMLAQVSEEGRDA